MIEQYKRIRERIPEHVAIVAAAKTRTADEIRNAIGSGITDIGENYVQEAEDIRAELGEEARSVLWHMIGHLQTNKVKKAVALFDMIQSVDSLRLAEDIDRRAGQIGRKIQCLIEINTASESAKTGIALAEAPNLIETAARMKHIELKGIMTIGPLTDDRLHIRAVFRKTKELFEMEKKIIGPGFDTLSIGMSDDYEIAIEEGSNMVRIGTAIFGSRQY